LHVGLVLGSLLQVILAMSKYKRFLISLFLLVLAANSAHASLLFAFSEASGQVTMQSSGTLNTANLLPAAVPLWGGTGIESSVFPDSDIMGDTSMGPLDLAFGFSEGTDFAPWTGTMFTQFGPFFGLWASVGTTQFATYRLRAIPRGRVPGIALASEDLVGALWSPDVSWRAPGTFVSLGLVEGTYTIRDARSAESITILIGQTSAVPLPSTPGLIVLSLLLLCSSSLRSGYQRREPV